MSLPLFLAIYCIEAGLFFTIVPWTRAWALNPLLHNHASIAAWADNPFVRGFVSGFGIVHLLIGVHDVVVILRARRRRQAG